MQLMPNRKSRVCANGTSIMYTRVNAYKHIWTVSGQGITGRVKNIKIRAEVLPVRANVGAAIDLWYCTRVLCWSTNTYGLLFFVFSCLAV